jgi:hypothetical protein
MNSPPPPPPLPPTSPPETQQRLEELYTVYRRLHQARLYLAILELEELPPLEDLTEKRWDPVEDIVIIILYGMGLTPEEIEGLFETSPRQRTVVDIEHRFRRICKVWRHLKRAKRDPTRYKQLLSLGKIDFLTIYPVGYINALNFYLRDCYDNRESLLKL